MAAGQVTVKALRDGAGEQQRQPLADVSGWAAALAARGGA
jgi:histidyl-tRNA synthetase